MWEVNKENKKMLHLKWDEIAGSSNHRLGNWLHDFKEEKGSLKIARKFAKENPEKIGFVTFPYFTGGWRFYWIEDGTATGTGAFECFARSQGYTMYTYQKIQGEDLSHERG